MSVDLTEIVKAAFAEGMRIGKDYKKFLIIEDNDAFQEWKTSASKEELEKILKSMPSDDNMKARAVHVYEEICREKLEPDEIPTYIYTALTNGIFLK